MAKRFTYSKTIHTFEGPETFTAVEFDSFDEAIKAVERGIYERRLEIGKKTAANGPGVLTDHRNPPPTGTTATGGK